MFIENDMTQNMNSENNIDKYAAYKSRKYCYK